MSIKINKTNCIDIIDIPQIVDIKTIIEKYFIKLEVNISNNDITIHDELSYLSAIADCFELFEDIEKWESIIFSLMKKQKNYIENYGNQIGLGLFSGLTDISTIVSLLNYKTGNYRNFLKSLNNFVYKKVILISNDLVYRLDNIKPNYFDLINGLSGTCHYLTTCEQETNRDNAIKSILSFLVKMVLGVKVVGNKTLPYWHIGEECFSQAYEKDLYPNGYLNFSLSHGACSVLYILAETFFQGIIVENQNKAIEYLLTIYKNYSELNKDDSIIYWPGIISAENFYNNNYKAYKSHRQSWCYGSIGISGSLLATSLFLEDKDLYSKMSKNIENISNKSIYNYELNSPIICHGYSGALAILVSSYSKNVKNINMSTIKELVKLLINTYDETSLFGYKDYTISDIENNVYIFKDRNSLLEGSSGIISTLASLIKEDTILDNYLLV